MAFLDKLKRKVEIEDNKINAVKKIKDTKKSSEFAQLDINIYQTASKFIITAPIPGVNINDLDISVEDENDVVTIQGKKNIPQEEGINTVCKAYEAFYKNDTPIPTNSL